MANFRLIWWTLRPGWPKSTPNIFIVIEFRHDFVILPGRLWYVRAQVSVARRRPRHLSYVVHLAARRESLSSGICSVLSNSTIPTLCRLYSIASSAHGLTSADIALEVANIASEVANIAPEAANNCPLLLEPAPESGNIAFGRTRSRIGLNPPHQPIPGHLPIATQKSSSGPPAKVLTPGHLCGRRGSATFPPETSHPSPPPNLRRATSPPLRPHAASSVRRRGSPLGPDLRRWRWRRWGCLGGALRRQRCGGRSAALLGGEGRRQTRKPHMVWGPGLVGFYSTAKGVRGQAADVERSKLLSTPLWTTTPAWMVGFPTPHTEPFKSDQVPPKSVQAAAFSCRRCAHMPTGDVAKERAVASKTCGI